MKRRTHGDFSQIVSLGPNMLSLFITTHAYNGKVNPRLMNTSCCPWCLVCQYTSDGRDDNDRTRNLAINVPIYRKVPRKTLKSNNIRAAFCWIYISSQFTFQLIGTILRVKLLRARLIVLTTHNTSASVVTLREQLSKLEAARIYIIYTLFTEYIRSEGNRERC